MTGMKTTDKWVLTVVTHGGQLHTKIRYGSHERDTAEQDMIKAALVKDVVRVSLDLIPNYGGNRITRVWV
jgi:hypothetical protein